MPAGWMINDDDPARLEIAERARKLKITGNPDSAAHALGPAATGDYTARSTAATAASAAVDHCSVHARMSWLSPKRPELSISRKKKGGEI